MDVLYVFDEPSVGLHPRDVHRLNELLHKLRDKGNTVLVVEHDRDVIKVADHVVDVGPHAGTRGGTIVYEGSFAGLLQADTLTGRHLNQSLPIKERVRSATGTLSIAHATVNNLQDVSVDLPMGVLTVVTGVAGSGKSSLIHQTFLRQYPDAVVVDQSAIGTSSRSNPATYTGIMDDVRKAFAAANTGLHMSDITHLLAILNRLVDTGNTFIVIEHNLDVISNADWIIDMGPEGGHKGGRVLFEGPPPQLLRATQSLTSAFLQR